MMEGGNAARELVDVLRAAARAAEAGDQARAAWTVTLDRIDGGAVLRAVDGATAWVVPTGASTYLEPVDRDGRYVWSGQVGTAALLTHLLRRGVTRAAVAAFVAGPSTAR